MRNWEYRRACTAVCVALAMFGAASRPAAAQVGAPIPQIVTDVSSLFGGVVVSIAPDCEADETISENVASKGYTLLASSSAGGAVIAALYRPPYPPGHEHGSDCPTMNVAGPPPGAYWVALVYGNAAPSDVPAPFWRQVVVPATCLGRPAEPIVAWQVVDNIVSMQFSPGLGCVTGHLELEAGATPGGTEIGTFALTTASVTAALAPGDYYVRLRGVSAAGTGPVSQEIPLAIPQCGPNMLPEAPVNPTAAVAGPAVTLSWSQTPGHPGPPITFHQVVIKEPSTGRVLDRVLRPPSTSIGALVPAGVYRVQVLSGNRCGTTTPLTPDVVFTVP